MSCELLCEWQPAPALPALSWLACEAGPWDASSPESRGASLPEGA